jgi:FAD dependent oxidoreductase/ABC transporter substrate binding protein
LTTYSGYAAEDNTARGPGGRPWLADGVTITGRLGSAASTAVVEPRAFTKGLMCAAEAHGAVLRHDTVVDLVHQPNGAVRGVALAGGEIIEGEAVVIAMGPWSILAARWLPLPAVLAQFREEVVAGGLLSYGASFPDLYRRAAELVDKILRGTKPADIPVEQPTKFDLIINLKTAQGARAYCST